MTPIWLQQARAEGEAKRPKSLHPKVAAPYLNLKFKSMTDTLNVEISEGVFVEFQIAGHYIDDDGVGAFEYHGFKGNHTRPFVVVTHIEAVAINGEQVPLEVQNEFDADFAHGRITAECGEVPE